MSRRSEMAADAQTERVQSERVDVTGALRDAAFTGAISFGLLLPLIGFKTDVNGSNELTLTTRWPLLFAFVAVIVIGRFLYALTMAPWLALRARRPAATTPSAWREFIRNWFVPFAVALVVAYP